MAFADPYFDENIGDLRNLLGAKSSEELRGLEPQIVFANELELVSLDIPRTNDLAELLAIHGQLFKGVYDWAGEIRTVDIKKNSDSAEYVFGELAKERYLRGLPASEFTERLAYFYDQVNYIHPFREGNGRAQRVFWNRVSHDAGYEIDWDAVVGDENDEASRLAAEHMDISALKTMFERIIHPLG